MRNISIQKISLFAQILVFTGLAIIQGLPAFWGVTFPQEYWVKQALMFSLWFATFQVNLNILLPKLLYKRQSALFFIGIAILIAIVIYASAEFDRLLEFKKAMNAHFHVSDKEDRHEKDVIGHFWTVILTLLLLGCSTIIGVAKQLRLDALSREQLENEKISSELSFLKTQINPHFFFNTLNSIYALAEGNPAAKDAVYNLSRLMRYVLYDTRNDETLLSKEVAFVEDYLKLMDLRMTPNVQVIFDKPTQLKDVSVAPMLFLPFVENAFKHGISSIQPSFVYIRLGQNQNSISIEVRNLLHSQQSSEKEESNGIGLSNTKRRLDLIYPGKYTLETREDETAAEYIVHLNLDLS